MERRNCWQAKGCGRQPGGENAEALGVCPAALPSGFDGTNQGEHGGRFCWGVAGTLCSGIVQGTFAAKLLDCIRCEFLQQVQEEQGRAFVLSPRPAKGVSDKQA
jgi:eukaryotic-like serine/threonine-protein kinase